MGRVAMEFMSDLGGVTPASERVPKGFCAAQRSCFPVCCRWVIKLINLKVTCEICHMPGWVLSLEQGIRYDPLA